MSEDKGYLKFLINEPIYNIQEEVIVEGNTQSEGKVSEKATENVPDEVAEPAATIQKPETVVTEKEPEIEPSQIKIPTKKLLVIYQFEESEPLPVNLKKLMLKIIGAVGIDVMKGVYINQSFKEIPPDLTDFENILGFSSETNLSLEGFQGAASYEIQQFSHTRILIADRLDQLEEQIPLKRKLWGVLQEMFPKN